MVRRKREPRTDFSPFGRAPDDGDDVLRRGRENFPLVVHAARGKRRSRDAFGEREEADEIFRGVPVELRRFDEQIGERLIAAEGVVSGGRPVSVAAAVSGGVFSAAPKRDFVERDAFPRGIFEHRRADAAVPDGIAFRLPAFAGRNIVRGNVPARVETLRGNVGPDAERVRRFLRAGKRRRGDGEQKRGGGRSRRGKEKGTD